MQNDLAKESLTGETPVLPRQKRFPIGDTQSRGVQLNAPTWNLTFLEKLTCYVNSYILLHTIILSTNCALNYFLGKP